MVGEVWSTFITTRRPLSSVAFWTCRLSACGAAAGGFVAGAPAAVFCARAGLVVSAVKRGTNQTIDGRRSIVGVPRRQGLSTGHHGAKPPGILYRPDLPPPARRRSPPIGSAQRSAAPRLEWYVSTIKPRFHSKRRRGILLFLVEPRSASLFDFTAKDRLMVGETMSREGRIRS